MRAKPEYRDRDETEVAVLDALADQNGEGMTVFAIRAEVDADIDTLENALANLKTDNLIEASHEDDRTVITVKSHVVGPDSTDDDEDFLDEIRRRFRL
jgi:F0F1-type ATP synthase epsilon subunit